MATRHENGNARGLGDAVVRPVLDVGQENDLALDGREAGERGEELSAEVGTLERAEGRVPMLRGERFVERHEPASLDRAEAVQRAAVDDSEQPGGESGWLATRRELFVGVHEGLLRDVVGVGGVAKDGEGARERGTTVSTHQCRERVLCPRQRLVNQRFVGQLGRHVPNRTPAGGEA